MKPEGARSGIAQLFVPNRFNKWFHLALAAVACGIPSPLLAQQITVDITPGHATNAISPMRSLGAGIDRDPLDSVKTIYAPTDIARMLSAGWGAISYRLNTELSIQAWHWNPEGQWSDPNWSRWTFADQSICAR